VVVLVHQVGLRQFILQQRVLQILVVVEVAIIAELQVVRQVVQVL